jgi:hypothetical protein
MRTISSYVFMKFEPLGAMVAIFNTTFSARTSVHANMRTAMRTQKANFDFIRMNLLIPD